MTPGGESCDVAVVGAGAAGLMAALWAARSLRGSPTLRVGNPQGSIIALDGAKKLGAKILVAGGGRCNVTHHEVDERQYAGSTPHAIRKVLRAFDVPRTVEFFRELGVELKREPTGKLFPTTDDAHTVLDALLGAARDAGVTLRHPWRVSDVRVVDDWFEVAGPEATLRARRVILAPGGMALPRTGSDGGGYAIVRALGHTVTPRVFPALVPLLLEPGHWITRLSGITVPATLELRSGTRKRLRSFTNSLLCTHFGLSGPGPMDMSRYYTDARLDDPGAHLVIAWLPGETVESVDAALLAAKNPLRWLASRGLPERLARELTAAAAVPEPPAPMPRERRRALATLVAQTPLPITGDRGFTFAEVTAGGVPLAEVNLDTMESRRCPGLHLCGEILDVDGRIGGFNFQWAWASGYRAGRGAASFAATFAQD